MNKVDKIIKLETWKVTALEITSHSIIYRNITRNDNNTTVLTETSYGAIFRLFNTKSYNLGTIHLMLYYKIKDYRTSDVPTFIERAHRGHI